MNKQYNMVMCTPSEQYLLMGQTDDPQWYVEIYHTEGKQLTANSWQTNQGVLHALEVNGTFCFSNPFFLSNENVDDIFDVPTTEEEVLGGAVDTVVEIQKQLIETAPMDGTTIIGYWEMDSDPIPHRVRYSPVYKQWILVGGEEDGEDTASPSHWSPVQ